MNFRMIGQVVGRVLCIEAALMLLPMIAAVIYDESPVPFLITIGITGGIGGGLRCLIEQPCLIPLPCL